MAADTSHHIIGLIPSRWGSSRFPGKPLHPIAGKPLVQHVWERVCRCSRLDAIAIATDDQRIFDAAVSFGARAIMTSPDHPPAAVTAWRKRYVPSLPPPMSSIFRGTNLSLTRP